MSLSEMKNLIRAIDKLRDAEHLLLHIDSEAVFTEMQSVRMAIENLEREAKSRISATRLKND